MNNLDPGKRRIAIGFFQSLGAQLITQLKLETFFACTRRMPHFAEVQEICESAFVRHMAGQAGKRRHQGFCDRLDETGASDDPLLKELIKRVRSRYRKVDPSLDNWITVCWVHGGLWLFSNEDRRRLLSVWLQPEAECVALSSTEAFRKRCGRLGVIGWNGFPSTYRVAPLHYNPSENISTQVWVEEAWKDIFLPGE